ncbi:extensin [Streptomyces sp. NPDC093600]|uniref:extensin n=1 Tax=Streptomyces sp. NPDC093600 TaxID=3366047 RepID=UPI003829003D
MRLTPPAAEDGTFAVAGTVQRVVAAVPGQSSAGVAQTPLPTAGLAAPLPVHAPGLTPAPAVRLTPPTLTPTPAVQRAPKDGPARVHAPQPPTPTPAPQPFPPTAAVPPSVQRTPHPEPPPPYSPPTPTTPTTTDEPPPAYTPVDFDARALTGAQVDELTHRLIGPLTRLLRTELRLDRERIGRLRDSRN